MFGIARFNTTMRVTIGLYENLGKLHKVKAKRVVCTIKRERLVVLLGGFNYMARGFVGKEVLGLKRKQSHSDTEKV